jgi:HTH-type transcriptional regulator / antitoxin HigA
MDTDLFPPGEFIRDELLARNWTQEDLADILGRPSKMVSQVISGQKRITTQTAQELAAAFGTSAEVWLNLESAYRLSVERHEQEAVGRRARLYELAPIKEMLRRGWIAPGDNTVDALELEVCKFFAIESLEQEPQLTAAARKSTEPGHMTTAQRAWLFRAKAIATVLQVERYTDTSIERHMEELRGLAFGEHEIRKVPTLLSQMGIRFVVCEYLPHTRIDGAAFWLDPKSPVIVLSLRYDRIDGFWHTLMHELSHIRHRDAAEVDDDLVGASRRASEDESDRRADAEAAASLVPPDKLDSFVARMKPRFSKSRIIQFANLHHIHPGIVVGQLQYRGEIKYSHSREMLVSVRGIVTDVALTDGWGIHPRI